jgi:PilZ domain-containing protein
MSVWVITVAAFLGTVLAGVCAFFLFSQRDRIRAALRTSPQRRTESRTPARVEVQLLGTDAPFINEITFTHNVSQYGARVITKTKWRPNDEVTLKLLRGGLSNEARIAYCKPLKGGEAFAIGLQFSSPVASWMA